MRTLRSLLVVVVLVVASAGATAGTSAYTVRRGDTLSGIADRLGVPVRALAEANGISDPDRVRAGDTLRLPGAGAAAAPVPAAATSSGARAVHVVRRGETLSDIAKRYRTTVRALIAANGISRPDRIRDGTELSLPAGAASAAAPPAAIRCPVQGQPRTVVHNWSAPRPGGRRHTGNDIFARRGAPVVAPVSGSLRYVRGAVAGNAFYLAGDDGTTYYGAHLHSLDAATGRIAAGARIGTVGSTGNASGLTPHLHFEIKPGGGAPVDPAATLRGVC